MATRLTTLNDLRTWVDNATSGWTDRRDDDVDAIAEALQAMDHPAWGTDWSTWLGGLPDLSTLTGDPVESTTVQYVIARRYHYYGPRRGEWSLYTVDAEGAPMRDGIVAHYATRADAVQADRDLHAMPHLPSGAGSLETRVVRADSRMARRLMRG